MAAKRTGGTKMETLNDIREFFSEYPTWVLVLCGLLLVSFVVLLIVGRRLQREDDDIQVFPTLAELNNNSHFDRVLAEATTLDMLAFSAHVLIDYRDELTAALERGASVRIVILDPDATNQADYDRSAALIGTPPATKRAEAADLLAYVRDFHARAARTAHTGTMEVRVLRERVLYSNIWHSRRADGTVCAHFTTYSYESYRASPSFRVCDSTSPFVDVVAREFRAVWGTAVPLQTATPATTSSTPPTAAPPAAPPPT